MPGHRAPLGAARPGTSSAKPRPSDTKTSGREPLGEHAMGKTVKTVLAIVIAAAIGGGAWLVANGGGAKHGGGALAALDKLRTAVPNTVAEKLSLGPDEDRPVRCRVGQEERFLRGLDCRQQGGSVLGDGSRADYLTVPSGEQRAAVAPTLNRRQPAAPVEKR